MTSYELIPSVSDKSPMGPSAGAPDYKIVNNDGTGIRSLNEFDKTFKSSIKTGGAWGKKKGGKVIKKKKTMNKKKMMNKKKTIVKKKSLVGKKGSAYKRSRKNIKMRKTLKIGGSNTGVGYTMDVKNTDTLNGAMATPYNVTRYEY